MSSGIGPVRQTTCQWRFVYPDMVETKFELNVEILRGLGENGAGSGIIWDLENELHQTTCQWRFVNVQYPGHGNKIEYLDMKRVRELKWGCVWHHLGSRKWALVSVWSAKPHANEDLYILLNILKPNMNWMLRYQENWRKWASGVIWDLGTLISAGSPLSQSHTRFQDIPMKSWKAKYLKTETQRKMG